MKVFKSQLILIATILTFIFMSSCTQKITKFESGIQADITNVTHTINTSLIVDGEKINLSCISFHIGGGFLLTCTHGIKSTEKIIRAPFGFITIPIVGLDYKYFIGESEIILIGEDEDISLLYSHDLIGTPKVEFQDSDYLRLGDKLMSIGNSNMDGANIKVGIVSRLFLNKSILGFVSNTAVDSFVMTNPTNRGDSGGPVFVIENGSYYFIGMMYGILNGADGYGFVFKSNYIMDVINKLKGV